MLDFYVATSLEKNRFMRMFVNNPIFVKQILLHKSIRGIEAFCMFYFQTFEKIKLTQLEKWHNASEDERLLIELDPKTIFHEAVENCKPLLITQQVIRGGVRYTVTNLLFHFIYCIFQKPLFQR